MGAAEISQPRDHHTRVGDRLLKRCETDAWITGRVMGDGRQRVAIGLRDVLSRDSTTRTPKKTSELRRLRRRFDRRRPTPSVFLGHVSALHPVSSSDSPFACLSALDVHTRVPFDTRGGEVFR